MVGAGLSTGVVSTLMVGVTNTSGLALPCLDSEPSVHCGNLPGPRTWCQLYPKT